MLRLGADIGATNVHGVVVDEWGHVVAEGEMPTRTGEDGVTAVLHELASSLAAQAGIGVKDFTSVGIGIPGVVDRDQGEVSSAVNLKLTRMPLAEVVSPFFSVRVAVDNDVKATVVGAANLLGCDSTTYLNLGTGVACATIQKMVIRGATNAAGEIGHLVIDPQGESCRCGQRGCLETIIGGHYLSLQMRRFGLDWTALDQDQRPEAQAVRSRVVEALTRTITLLTLAYDSCMIVLGGGVVRSAPWLIDAVREDLEAKAATATFPDYSGMDDRVTVLDDDQRVAAIGAALMGCHDLSTTVGAKV